MHGFPSGSSRAPPSRRPGSRDGGAAPRLLTGCSMAPPCRTEEVETPPTGRLWRKILVAALVGIPWIPLAAALYAWIG